MKIDRKFKKMHQFQVIVELENGITIFDSTNETAEVADWLKTFEESVQATSIKVYQKDKQGVYTLSASQNKTYERKIGFCRGW